MYTMLSQPPLLAAIPAGQKYDTRVCGRRETFCETIVVQLSAVHVMRYDIRLSTRQLSVLYKALRIGIGWSLYALKCTLHSI